MTAWFINVASTCSSGTPYAALPLFQQLSLRLDFFMHVQHWVTSGPQHRTISPYGRRCFQSLRSGRTVLRRTMTLERKRPRRCGVQPRALELFTTAVSLILSRDIGPLLPSDPFALQSLFLMYSCCQAYPELLMHVHGITHALSLIGAVPYLHSTLAWLRTVNHWHPPDVSTSARF